MEIPAPQQIYVIYFTPRSGSSRVTEIASATGTLGSPQECFHPRQVPRLAARNGARSLDEYVQAAMRERAPGGVFGCEVNAVMIEQTFGGAAQFMKYFRDAPCFWLIRKDIVAQAVSLAKMVKTKVSHAPLSTEEERAAADSVFEYDPENIRHWLYHLREMEVTCEKIFARFGVSPTRLSYERLSGMADLHIAQLIARNIGVAEPHALPLVPKHTKIGTARNIEFADRFEAEHPRLMARLARERATILESC
ncbi:LPS sulfotransferase NodH [Poseidonocella pacifica]|uniref:LPS sulfotransferase NodH n=1 Tax=Poseidonocella pacifica TaxID=871651 RepID=A0A1I0V436_9RHOB|nr:Stf0 family sulfotransferase [Poseidonocella pacifica]SFA70850.1 LPS sulfotransferase NodH [Poseidonocella pacifica]